MAEFMAEPTIEFSEADASLLPDYKIEATIREHSEEKPPQCFYLIPPEMALAERPALKFGNGSCRTTPLPRMLILPVLKVTLQKWLLQKEAPCILARPQTPKMAPAGPAPCLAC